MKKYFGLLVLVLYPILTQADQYPKNSKIDILNYVFKILLSDATDEIQCEVSIDVQYLTEGISVLRLDLIKTSPSHGNKGMTVTNIQSNGKLLTFKHENDILNVDLSQPSKAGQKSTYVISYHGTPATGLKIANNKYGDRTFFSDNWPDKGRNWLPIIDHPYDKATCEFIITAPSHYQVVSNGLKIEETDLNNGMRLTHWKQSVPISSWLYVLGVARFATQQVDHFNNKSIETWVYYQDRDKGFYDFAVPTKQVLEFYSSYVGPFAYERLANIQSNSVSGGMEAASSILYSENSVVGDRNERWRNVVIHEIAHQWFGNAVTEYDWDDVWLSEGFATYFTLLFIEHQYGRDEFLKGLADSKKKVDAFHLKNPGYTIIHNNLADMNLVTSSQTYQKGSWVLHMLRGMVGTDNFWKGIRSYYRNNMNGSSSTSEFRKEMEAASGIDLKDFFDQWLYKSGVLKLDIEWRYEAVKKQVSVKLIQSQTDGSLFKMPIEIGIQDAPDKSLTIHKIQLNEKESTITLPAANPIKLVVDPNNWVLMEITVVKK